LYLHVAGCQNNEKKTWQIRKQSALLIAEIKNSTRMSASSTVMELMSTFLLKIKMQMLTLFVALQLFYLYLSKDKNHERL